MTSSLTSTRYERKFVANGHNLAEVLALVRRHPAAFREVFPARIVNNIYLDSPDLRDYHDHVNGSANRLKTRVRWYGEPASHIEEPMLERKLKRGLVSGKLAWPLPDFALNGTVVRSHLSACFDRGQLPELLRSSLRHIEPSLFNQYRRHYFLSADKRFRVTVDSSLRFGSLRKNNRAELQRLSLPHLVVIELKFDTAAAEDADRITNLLPFRLTRCSKYVLGIEATN